MMKEININNISPEGWIRHYIAYEKKGIIGHRQEDISEAWVRSVAKVAMLLKDDDFFKLIEEQDSPEAMWALYKKTDDKKYAEKLETYYLSVVSDDVEGILKIYEITGNERLAELAETICKNSYDLNVLSVVERDRVIYKRIRNNAIMYLYLHKKSYLEIAVSECDEILEKHMLLDGMHSLGMENTKIHETGNISHFVWTLGYMLMATGNSKYADAIERAVINAGIASIGPYFGSVQSLAQVNQLSAAENSILVDWEQSGTLAMPKPQHPFDCTANAGRLIPEYAERMYMEDENRVYINLYGDSVYNKGNTKIIQSGQYPFEDKVKIEVTGGEVNLALRIPCWCDNFRLMKNDEEIGYNSINGYANVNSINNGDAVTVLFNTEVKAKRCAEGIYFEYGVVLLSLRIGELWKKKDLKVEFPEYNVYAFSAWNMAASINTKLTELKVQRPLAPWWGGYFFSTHPLEFKTVLREVDGWEDKDNVPDIEYMNTHLGKLHEAVLVPYGATTIRLTVFPEYSEKETLR